MNVGTGVMASQTTMSLDERFTHLRRAETSGGIRMGARARIENRIEAATAKNRRLAMQMARRPAVIAALNNRRGKGLQRSPSSPLSLGQSRFGRGNSVGRGIGGGGGAFRSLRGRGIGRPGKLIRSLSLQSLTGRNTGGGNLQNRIGRSPSLSGRIGFNRGRGSVRGRGGRGRLFRSSSLNRLNTFRSDSLIRRGSGSFGRGARGSGRGLTNTRGRGRGGRNFRGGRGGRFNRNRGRGRGGRGRGGRGRGGRGRGEANKPTKEALDKELEQYMSASKIALDKDIDNYMNQPQEKWN